MGWIYLIINKINGKMYVGRTIRSLNERINEHKSRIHSIVDQAIKKYGWENFAVVEWKYVSWETIGEEENRWTIFFDTLSPKGYNLVEPEKDGYRGLSNETRRKMSKSQKGNQHFLGKTHGEETKKKIGEKSKGRYFSSEARQKMSDSHKGRHYIPQESREKLSQDRRGKNNPMYGISVYDLWIQKYGKEVADGKIKEMVAKRNAKRSKS